MPPRKFLKRKCEYLLIIGVLRLAQMLPRNAGLRLFSGLGGLADKIFKRDHRRAVENLAIAFPESHAMVREAMTRAMFKNLGRNVFDFFQLEGVSAQRLDQMVESVEGMHHFREAEAAGKGVIVITGHIGCWEIMPAYFATRLGYAATVVGRRMKDRRLNDRLVSIRSSFGVTTVDRDDSPREMISALRRGELLGVLIDQHTSVAGTYVPFFNRPAFTPTGVAKLACLTGARIVPMAVFLGHDGRHTIHVLPQITPPAVIPDKRQAVEELTAQCSLAIEKLVRIDPKQWVWFHHRWREREERDVGIAANA